MAVCGRGVQRRSIGGKPRGPARCGAGLVAAAHNAHLLEMLFTFLSGLIMGHVSAARAGRACLCRSHRAGLAR